jgi:ribosome-associated heat shock protein Hsp15
MPKRVDCSLVADSADWVVRLDKWLWAARFFKTRQNAIDAINAGHVDVNNERAKPARTIKINDTLLLRKPPYTFHLIVKNIAEKRGSAMVARTLFEETCESLAARERFFLEQRDMPPPLFKGRPTKQDRRAIQKFERFASDSTTTQNDE